MEHSQNVMLDETRDITVQWNNIKVLVVDSKKETGTERYNTSILDITTMWEALD